MGNIGLINKKTIKKSINNKTYVFLKQHIYFFLILLVISHYQRNSLLLALSWNLHSKSIIAYTEIIECVTSLRKQLGRYIYFPSS